MSDANPVLVYLAELTEKADQLYVSKFGRSSVRLDHCDDETTARFISDRLRERFIVPKAKP